MILIQNSVYRSKDPCQNVTDPAGANPKHYYHATGGTNTIDPL
jgi:hypothetical protein